MTRGCEHCGDVFVVDKYDGRYGAKPQKFCSRDCTIAAQMSTAEENRFSGVRELRLGRA